MPHTSYRAAQQLVYLWYVYILVAALCLIPISQTQGTITSLYGWRQVPPDSDLTFHAGIDIGAVPGTPIRAVEGGTVTFAYADMRGDGGKVVDITSPLSVGQLLTRYGHLQEILVTKGEEVKRGQLIGLVGSTGNSTGPHLHFEVMTLLPNGLTAYHDPVPWVCDYRQNLLAPHFKSFTVTN